MTDGSNYFSIFNGPLFVVFVLMFVNSNCLSRYCLFLMSPLKCSINNTVKSQQLLCWLCFYKDKSRKNIKIGSGECKDENLIYTFMV